MKNNRSLKKKEQLPNQEKTENENSITSRGDAWMFSCEEEQHLHIEDKDSQQAVDTVSLYHAVTKKGLWTSYKSEDFGTLQIGNISHAKTVRIGDACI